MREFMLIFKQAFVTKGKTKSFIITTAIMIAGIFLLANMTSIIDTVKKIGGESSEEILYVFDESGQVFESLEAQFMLNESEVTLNLSTKDKEVLIEEVRNDKIDSLVVIDLTADNTIESTYYTMSSMEYMLPMMIEDALQSIQTELKAAELSLTGEQVQTLFTPVQFETHSLSPSAKSEEELNQARGLVYVLMFLIYFAVIFYSNMIAMEVATEKSSRVMEILISSVSPVKHLFAKVLGIGTLGLLQMALLGASAFIALKTTSADMVDGLFMFFGFSNLDVGTIIYAIVFFLLGYFLYATLAALLGSLVSRTEDVNQMIMPMTFLIIIAFMLAAAGIGNPELAYLKYTSYIPFFAPLVMFLRVGMLDLPMWEPILSIAIMLITIFIFGWFGARVYKGGVLMYGPSRSLKDIKKAIQLGKE
ncbi:ABC transporter permease [Sporosarcina pasteurii]|uniref:ABC-2 family transporter protein n=1 Tax=Sporosarcina pasteurii TaxID=1474 RepID=A0A380C9W4_SPOPA|nr:ABC transporter permease [Sporosarcina pasteurii]MDS9472666.1 ABC transporter permease [Sporosarcina pasteurii]QBQ04326.1 ABC transporter permease [Sporosarcina pasteurii]SUJ15947.1 ABC-2 family transporter protein [Sporosarcina pasteurii]